MSVWSLVDSESLIFRPSLVFFRFIDLVNEIPAENEQIPQIFSEIILMVRSALYFSLATGLSLSAGLYMVIL